MFPLVNTAQYYDWGSPADIPHFLGADADGRPVAELWMGTHPLAPSRAVDANGVERDLTEVSGALPFLMKILAARRPLSLQVHPSRGLARKGFAREEAAGIPLTAPNRTYKDANHKPEMAYALTTFDTLVGFRPTAEILRVLTPIESAVTKRLVDDLRGAPGFAGLVRLVEGLLRDGVSEEEFTEVVASCQALVDDGIDIKRAYVTAVEVAEHYPGDVGVIISLMLNRLTLQPGEAAFLGTGVIHAHLSGMCVEVMAASDNVLRAGLTTKHIDAEGLVTCLDKGMSRVARVNPEHITFSTEVFSPDAEEFALAVTQTSHADPLGVDLPATGHRIIMCTGGEVTVINEHGDRVDLARGASVYLGPDDGRARVAGLGEVAQCYQPSSRAPHSDLVDLV